MKNTFRKTLNIALVVGCTMGIYKMCTQENNIPTEKTNFQYGKMIESAKIIQKEPIDTTQPLEKTISTQYFVNTVRGIMPITKDNLYYSFMDWSMWKQSTKGYERTKDSYVLNNPAGMPGTLAIMVDDTLRPFYPRNVLVSYDGLSTTKIQGN